MVNSEELIGTTQYLTVKRECGINRCCYKRVCQYITCITYLLSRLYSLFIYLFCFRLFPGEYKSHVLIEFIQMSYEELHFHYPTSGMSSFLFNGCHSF